MRGIRGYGDKRGENVILWFTSHGTHASTEVTALSVCLQVKLKTKLSQILWGDELQNQGLEQLKNCVAGWITKLEGHSGFTGRKLW